jgi:hypothetical protein
MKQKTISTKILFDENFWCKPLFEEMILQQQIFDQNCFDKNFRCKPGFEEIILQQ